MQNNKIFDSLLNIFDLSYPTLVSKHVLKLTIKQNLIVNDKKQYSLSTNVQFANPTIMLYLKYGHEF